MSSPQRPRTSITKVVSHDLDLENERLRIEEERLKNILNGLNEKLTVFNDLKTDVDQHNKMIKQSESARDGLQVTIKKTSVEIHQQGVENKKY